MNKEGKMEYSAVWGDENDIELSSKKSADSNTKKVVVIGKGRFGTAAAQGLRESFIKNDDDRSILSPVEVVHVSATRFTSISTSTMAEQLLDTEYVVYCGTQLPLYAAKLALAMKRAKQQSTSRMEFIDFSNPDPIYEKEDITGALDLWTALNMGNNKKGSSMKDEHSWTIWKVTDVGSLDVAGTEGTTKGKVYKAGSSADLTPNLRMPNLTLVPAPIDSNSLYDEADTRIMERSQIDRWYDGTILGFAVFVFTSIYAIVRYNEHFNGSEPTQQIPMYLLDKSFGWTALWMMVVSPFAGNLLAIGALYGRFGSLPLTDKIVTILSTLIMFLPTAFYFFGHLLWILFRNMFFASRGGVTPLYVAQFSKERTTAMLKASLIDTVTLKGESGCVGFIYCLVHSFMGLVCCDVAYKGYWFNETNGRLHARMEVSMTTGCVSTVILWAVAMRSLFGKASWIRMKPLYAYASPIGMWFAVVHVMAFGAKGWVKLFKKEYHRGQLSITFVSSMFPAGILLVHHLMAFFNTKRHISDKHLWRHSITNIATQEVKGLRRQIEEKGHHSVVSIATQEFNLHILNNKENMSSWVKDYKGSSKPTSNSLTPTAA